MAANLGLIGFMGVGKSTVGKLAAEALGYRFEDLDDAIATRAGRDIPAIFELWGEVGFRQLETACLRSGQGLSRAVVAVGGGAPTRAENLSLLRSLGCICLLTASAGTVLARVQPIETRPMLAGATDPLGRIEELLAARREAYGIADFSVDTEGRTPENCAAEVVEKFTSWLAVHG
jgi:shikimate kinase